MFFIISVYILFSILIGILLSLFVFLLSYLITKIQMFLDDNLLGIEFFKNDFKSLYKINVGYIVFLHFLILLVIYSIKLAVGDISILYKNLIIIYMYLASIFPLMVVYKLSHIESFIDKPMKPLILNVLIIFIVFILLGFIRLYYLL